MLSWERLIDAGDYKNQIFCNSRELSTDSL